MSKLYGNQEYAVKTLKSLDNALLYYGLLPAEDFVDFANEITSIKSKIINGLTKDSAIEYSSWLTKRQSALDNFEEMVKEELDI